MARPRQFDTNKVLRKIMTLFWTRGYDTTSFSDLERCTGLKRASLFAAFGDKETLFQKALELYFKEKTFQVRTLLSEGPAVSALRRWLEHETSGHGRRSAVCCLGITTSLGIGRRNPRCRKVIEKHTIEVELILRRVLEEGIERGELRLNLDVSAAVNYLLVVLSGLSVNGALRSRGHRRRHRKTLDIALSALLR